MPNINDLIPSKYLKQTDLGEHLARLLTVAGGELIEFEKSPGVKEKKFVLTFEETDKGLPLNAGNLREVANISKADDTDDWAGTRVVVYWDPSVMFAGRKTGGMRIRAPKGNAAGGPVNRKAAATPPPEEVLDDDIPF